jgi:hypothetical protein
MFRQSWRMLAAAGLLSLAVGCVARVETDPAPSKIDVDVNPPGPRKVDVDVDVTPKP